MRRVRRRKFWQAMWSGKAMTVDAEIARRGVEMVEALAEELSGRLVTLSAREVQDLARPRPSTQLVARDVAAAAERFDVRLRDEVAHEPADDLALAEALLPLHRRLEQLTQSVAHTRY